MTQVFVPRESVNDQTVIVQRVLVPSGGTAGAGATVVEIETSKTVIEVSAPVPGVITHALAAGQELEVGTLLFTVGDADAAGMQGVSASAADTRAPAIVPAVASAPEASSEGAGAPTAAAATPPLLSKAAQAAAARLGVSLDRFQGRWVTQADIERGRPAATQAEAEAPRTAPPAFAPVPASRIAAAPTTLPPQTFTERANGMRKRAEIDSLTKGRHAETASTIAVRVVLPGERIVAPDFLFRDSISDLVVFEGARLLRQFPELNAFDIDGRRAGLYADVHFGISFDNVANLKVLTLRDADKRTLPDLHRGFSELLDLFESNKTIPQELLGTSTVTLSDLSTTGASFMLPLINGQQSLILGIVKHAPRSFEVFASFDHRVTEGLRVTRFLDALRDRIVSHYRDDQGHARLCCRACAKTMQDETRLGQRGMVNMTLPSGENALLCRNCFEGL